MEMIDIPFRFILIMSNTSGMVPYDGFEPLRIRNLILMNNLFKIIDNDAFLSSHQTISYLDISKISHKFAFETCFTLI